MSTSAKVSEDVSEDTRVDLALARLQASRAQLRAAMLPPPQTHTSSSSFGLPRRWRAMWRAWTRSGPAALAAATAMSAVKNWWRSQPWHATTELAGRAVLAETMPLVRRHPLWAVMLGAGVGAAVVTARPWRWAAVNSRVRPIGGRVLRWALAQMSQVPVQMALAALLAQFVSQRSRSQASEPPAPDEPGNPGHPGQPAHTTSAAPSDAAVPRAVH